MSSPHGDATLAAFEAANDRGDEETVSLELYVAGASPRSLSATERIRDFCDRYLRGRYTFKVFDLHERPDLARSANVICAPTLIKREPAPRRVLVGDLSDLDALRRALGIAAADA